MASNPPWLVASAVALTGAAVWFARQPCGPPPPAATYGRTPGEIIAQNLELKRRLGIFSPADVADAAATYQKADADLIDTMALELGALLAQLEAKTGRPRADLRREVRAAAKALQKRFRLQR